MGDFNIDMNSDSPGAKQLVQQMTNLGYRQLITSPTCDTGSIIDLIFTNFPEDMEVCLFVCLVLNDASTLVGH